MIPFRSLLAVALTAMMAPAFAGPAAGLPQTASRGTPAAIPNQAEKDFLQVAITVMAIDRLADRCTQGTRLSTLDAARLTSWQTDHRVPDVRAAIATRQAVDPWRSWLTQARSVAEDSVDKMNMNPCTALLAAIRVPSAQFATSAPAVLASLETAGTPSAPAPPVPATASPTVSGTTGSGSGSGGAAAPPGAPVPAPASAANTRALLDQIDSFGFDSAAAMGVGGFITTRIYPVVLFKNGDVLTDVEGLAFKGGLEAHRRAYPAKWGKWRRSGGTIEITGSKGWEKLSFPATYQALPDDFRLNGLYRHLGGTGNVAIGGTDAVSVVTDYTFFADGRMIRGGAAGAQSQAGNTSTVIASTPPNRRGRYRIDGLTLAVTYDDGRQEQMIIVTDPKDPKGAIWLDGVGLVQRSR